MEGSVTQSKWRAYSHLMRIDKPIGTLLLLWPTLWALWLAGKGVPPLSILLVFVLGVFLMRAAGCVVNDYADRAVDGYVKRTAGRPMPSGRVSAKEAKVLFVVLVLISFCLVLTLNAMTIWLSLAALALADAAGLPRASSLKALTTFTGLAHRFQLAWENNGVRWINDSKATNVGSTEAALNGLQVDGTLHLLLGGDGKSADFSPLARYLQGDNVRLYCFGRDGAQLAQLRPEVATLTETMEQAMRTIAGRVQPGDMVLLSPACASLDQFRNFEVRGDEFARLAQELGG